MFSLPKPLRLVVSLALFTGALLLALLLGLSSPSAANAQAGPPRLETASQAAGWQSGHGLALQSPAAYRSGSPAMLPGSALPAAQGGLRAQSPSDTPHARVNVAHSAVDGSFGPGATVQFTVTTSGGTPKGGGQGTARPDGWMDGIPCNCNIEPGDHVRVTSNLGFDAVLVPIYIGGKIDAKNDLVSGQMSGGIFPGGGFAWAWSNSRQQGFGRDIAIDGNPRINGHCPHLLV